jgi:hypothetical protein
LDEAAMVRVSATSTSACPAPVPWVKLFCSTELKSKLAPPTSGLPISLSLKPVLTLPLTPGVAMGVSPSEELGSSGGGSSPTDAA